jgi:hypothetical protein
MQVKKRKEKEERKKIENRGCLKIQLVIWLVCILIGIIISLVTGDSRYIFIFTVLPPIIKLILLYGVW